MRKLGHEIAWSYFDYKNENIAEWEIALQNEARQDHIIFDMDGLMYNADISVWQMLHSLKSLALFQAYRHKYPNKKLIMELDDDVFNVNPESLASEAYRPNSDMEYISEYQIKNASAMIVSTEYLKKSIQDKFYYWNKEWVGASKNKNLPIELRKILKTYPHDKRIEVIPNSIDFDVWDKLENKNNNKKIRIGWAGGSAHKLDLAIVNKIIPTILDKYKNVEFMIFGGMPEYMKATDRILHHSQWFGIDNYPSELAKLGFDIALAPLKDNEFNRCKSNLRWLEMSALKIPTVCSNVEPFKKSVISDSTGMIANTPEEWIQAISELVEHKVLRESIGKNAYNYVKKWYNISRTSKIYMDTLLDIHKDKSLDKVPIISENPLEEKEQLKELQKDLKRGDLELTA